MAFSRSPPAPTQSIAPIAHAISLIARRTTRKLGLNLNPAVKLPRSKLNLYTKTLNVFRFLSYLSYISSHLIHLPFPHLVRSIRQSLAQVRQSAYRKGYHHPLTYVMAILVLLNVRSFPGAWHCRVLWCVVKIRMRYAGAWLKASTRYYYRSFLRSTLSCDRVYGPLGRVDMLHTGSKESEDFSRVAEMEEWLKSVTPIGEHLFEWEGRYKTWVGFDDSDFNMHMSNSSYPKILDFARTKASLDLFPHFLRVGGHVALSSTHFHFIKEIPIFTKFQLRLSIGAWDEKWCYIITRFITQDRTSGTANCNRNSSSSSLTSLPRILLNGLELESGITLHTIAVSRVCFKVGRITVPPAVVFCTNGMSMHPWEIVDCDRFGCGDRSSIESLSHLSRFSQSNPPPSWINNTRYLIAKTYGGCERKLREFYIGGWRSVVDPASTPTLTPSRFPHIPAWAQSPNSSDEDLSSFYDSECSSPDSDTRPATTVATPDSEMDTDTDADMVILTRFSVRWWDKAMGVGGSADVKRKERLEICRMLVGGMEGVGGFEF
ncbi:hypothetical protein BDP27DRAFT_1429422 [Rhodocollybia butyracea]|uniref:Uncharacterized protein n=1 Tax=Rhodocollybia butyracea TaxID=206335 RepID=A0A9P5PD64_9AGAR|nr:hypothetical protein BDP27DRAFT_1429422 [Rhodocollybia butyracea]